MKDYIGVYTCEQEGKQVHSEKPDVYWCVHVSCLFGFVTCSDDHHPAWEPPTHNTWGFEEIVNLYIV